MHVLSPPPMVFSGFHPRKVPVEGGLFSLVLTRPADRCPWRPEPGFPMRPVSPGLPRPWPSGPRGGSPHIQEAELRCYSFVPSSLFSAAESSVARSSLLREPAAPPPGSAGAWGRLTRTPPVALPQLQGRGGQGKPPRESRSHRPLLGDHETETLSPPQVSPRSFATFSKAEQAVSWGVSPMVASGATAVLHIRPSQPRV